MSKPKSPQTKDKQGKPKRPRKGFWREVRELWDTLVLAFVLVTLMKTFIVDLYKIPSGSMTPTLIGDPISVRDFDGDGREDLMVFDYRPVPGRPPYLLRQVFLRNAKGQLVCDTDRLRDMSDQGIRFDASSVRLRFDRIFVNKMWYWFRPLRRGDIVVFKLPDRPNPSQPNTNLFNPDTPFYIKRVAALETETPTVNSQGQLLIDSEVVAEPEIFTEIHYFNDHRNVFHLTNGRVRYGPYGPLPFLGVEVPEDGFYVFGDNSGNSLDSRYWGAVDVDRLRGRAFFRYWPLREISFLR